MIEYEINSDLILNLFDLKFNADQHCYTASKVSGFPEELTNFLTFFNKEEVYCNWTSFELYIKLNHRKHPTISKF